VFKPLLYGTIKRAGHLLGIEISHVKSAIGVMDGFLQHLQGVGFKPNSILDVGANQGDWSRLASRYFPHSKFILIEPQIEYSAALDAFCRLASGSAWHLAGAGRKPGEMELIVWPDHARSSLLFRPEADGNFERRRIPIITIDSLFANPEDCPHLVKLDIQGFELEALAGATTLFGRTECFIVEVNFFERVPGLPLFADVVAFFNDRGYKAYDIPGSLRRPQDHALWQIDLAFVRKGGPFDAKRTFVL